MIKLGNKYGKPINENEFKVEFTKKNQIYVTKNNGEKAVLEKKDGNYYELVSKYEVEGKPEQIGSEKAGKLISEITDKVNSFLKSKGNKKYFYSSESFMGNSWYLNTNNKGKIRVSDHPRWEAKGAEIYKEPVKEAIIHSHLTPDEAKAIKKEMIDFVKNNYELLFSDDTEYLYALVRRELHILKAKTANKKALPRLAKYIERDEGFEHAEDVIFNMAAREGISVQAAMASYDSDLENY